MKKFKQSLCLITLLLATVLFSCVQVEKKGSESEAKVETNAVEEQVSHEENLVALGEELTSLEGEVYTLSHYKLPKVDDELYGFKVNAIYDYDERNAKVVLFEHKKTGSKVFLISNDDVDKTAAFGFNTLTFDDKGVPHVFEHACLGGSEKYPNSNLFDEATNRTYNTFMNAFTMQHATVYPFSSLSDPQLFALYKFYMDGVFNPNIIRDEKNLEKEAYRYTLDNEKGDIDLNGIVYSEMSGVEGNISQVAYRNSLKSMFKDSFMGVNTGGVTEEIPKMTHDDLIEFHKKYYHPSNMVMVLYGDLDYEKYLKYADDEYLSKYDKKEINKEDSNYKKHNEFHVERFDFPVASDSDIEGQTLIYYDVICEGMTSYESGLFEVVLSALENSDGPLNKIVKEKLPKANFTLSNALFMPKPYFSIVFSNVNEEDADTIKEIVEESFKEIKESGISSDVLENIINYMELEIEYGKDTHGFANNSSLFFARTFSTNGENLLGYFQHDKAMRELENCYKNGTIKGLIDKYIGISENSSMEITIPKKGLLEENSLKLKESLKKMKDGMTDEEIKDLVKKTEEFNTWIENEAKTSLISVLRVATISELDEYKAKCYAYEEKIEGINFIRSEIDDLKYNNFNILFDISNLTKTEAMKLKLLSSALLEFPSKNYPDQKLQAALNKYTAYNSEGIMVNTYYNGGYKPYYEFSFMSLDRNIDKVFELLHEVMNNMIFEDVDIFRNYVSSELNTTKSAISNSPTSIAGRYVNVKTNDDALYSFNISGVSYMNFLKEVIEMGDDELRDLLKECEKLYKGTYNRQGMTSQIIGNFDTIKNIKSRIIEMAYDFKNEKVLNNIDIATVSELKDRIAVVANGTVQYNYLALPLRKNGIDFTAKYEVLGSIINDVVLYQEFRVKRSAYGAYSSFDRLRTFVYTYRDPNLRESYEVFKDIPKLAKNIKLSKEELDDYKLNAYSQYAYPITKFVAASTAVDEVLNRTDDKLPNRLIRYMKEIKDMKLEDVTELLGIYDKMVKEGICVTVGGREAIEMNADLFDDIIYDYIK